MTVTDGGERRNPESSTHSYIPRLAIYRSSRPTVNYAHNWPSSTPPSFLPPPSPCSLLSLNASSGTPLQKKMPNVRCKVSCYAVALRPLKSNALVPHLPLSSCPSESTSSMMMRGILLVRAAIDRAGDVNLCTRASLAGIRQGVSFLEAELVSHPPHVPPRKLTIPPSLVLHICVFVWYFNACIYALCLGWPCRRVRTRRAIRTRWIANRCAAANGSEAWYDKYVRSFIKRKRWFIRR